MKDLAYYVEACSDELRYCPKLKRWFYEPMPESLAMNVFRPVYRYLDGLCKRLKAEDIPQDLQDSLVNKIVTFQQTSSSYVNVRKIFSLAKQQRQLQITAKEAKVWLWVRQQKLKDRCETCGRVPE
jgi:hypothetical protein